MKNYAACACGLLAFSLAILVATGCMPPSAPAPAEEPELPKETAPVPLPTVATAPTTTLPPDHVPAVEKPDTGDRAIPLPFESPTEMAVHDLASRLGVDSDDVVVMDIKELEMPAADLGCPGAPSGEAKEDPGGMVMGQEIVLAVGSSEYIYRAHGWQVVACRPPAELPLLPKVLPPGQVGAPTEAARQDLSKRLAMSLEEIEVQSVEAVEWPDASLGCPQPGMMYAQVITPGYRILLKTGDETYEYHSDQKRAILCQPE